MKAQLTAEGQKYEVSQLTGQLTLYTPGQLLLTTEHFEYPLDALITLYDSEFQTNNLDAYVENITKIRTFSQDNLVMDLWFAIPSESAQTEQRLIAQWAALILIIIVLTASIVVILSAAASVIERLFPTGKFYTPDGKVFTSPTEYITYMQNVYNPAQGKPYTCMYCGQGFATQAERDEHQTTCAWAGGYPGPITSPGAGVTWLIQLLIIGAAVIIGGYYILPKIFKKKD